MTRAKSKATSKVKSKGKSKGKATAKSKAKVKAKGKAEVAAPTSASNTDDAAVGRYVQTAGRIKAGLTKTIKHLKKKRRSAPFADRPLITQQISMLRDEFGDVQADLLAYLDEQLSISPPTADDVEAIRKLADELDGMIANAVATKTILDAATKLADSLQG